jgi:hypothetical protein
MVACFGGRGSEGGAKRRVLEVPRPHRMALQPRVFPQCVQLLPEATHFCHLQKLRPCFRKAWTVARVNWHAPRVWSAMTRNRRNSKGPPSTPDAAHDGNLHTQESMTSGCNKVGKHHAKPQPRGCKQAPQRAREEEQSGGPAKRCSSLTHALAPLRAPAPATQIPLAAGCNMRHTNPHVLVARTGAMRYVHRDCSASNCQTTC